MFRFWTLYYHLSFNPKSLEHLQSHLKYAFIDPKVAKLHSVQIREFSPKNFVKLTLSLMNSIVSWFHDFWPRNRYDRGHSINFVNLPLKTFLNCAHNEYNAINCAHNEYNAINCKHNEYNAINCAHNEYNSKNCAHYEHIATQIDSNRLKSI